MILLLDNYDSFTYNIYQIVAENVSDTLVYRNDEINIQKINELNPDKMLVYVSKLLNTLVRIFQY